MEGVRMYAGIGMIFDKISEVMARRGAFIGACAFAAALALPAAPASANILVTIDKSTQEMSVAVDGAQRYVWPVSTGRPGYDTPNGTFKPNRMDADHYSQEWDNAPMPRSEERRVGKECRSRWWPKDEQNKKQAKMRHSI